MNHPAPVDYIIVGQGLAGSAIALQLIRGGKKVLVIDEPSRNHSSQVAAGLFNPVTGKNAVKTWYADVLFPYLSAFYRDAEQVTGARFFSPKVLYRPFASISEQNEWMGRSADDAYQPFIQEIQTTSRLGLGVQSPYGALALKQCGTVNMPVYLEAVRNYIRSTAIFEDRRFDEQQLILETDGIIYERWKARKIIFCQGIRNLENQWFRGLPIRPLKGETLTIKTSWEEDFILNRGVYMVPGSVPGEYRIGSTYKFNNSSPGITDEGKVELEGKLKELFTLPYQVIGQNWGVRPTSIDRRPILGHHPDSEKLIIFNGLGSKGVSLAPYFSEVLFRWLENTGTLLKDVDVTRFY
jgi:glycine/D-amino acid oxidase-like deaminating enzyme